MSGAGASRVSLLNLVQEFDTSLRNSLLPLLPASDTPSLLPSSALLHPLSSLPSPIQTKTDLRSTLATIKATLAAFSPVLNSNPPTKLLALLRETSGSEAVLLSHQADIFNLRHSLSSRAPYPLIPPLATPSSQQTLAILNQIGHAAVLALFTDHSPSSDIHTISLGGTIMVVDIDVMPSGAVARARFSYVSAAQTDDEEIAREIESCLQGMDAIDSPVLQGAIEDGLRRFFGLLQELKRLDELTERSTRDCFALVKHLAKELVTALAAEPPDNPFFPTSHGSMVASAVTPRPRIAYHRATLLFPPVAIAKRLSERLSSLEINLHEVLDGSAVFLATLEPAIPITAEAGKRILAVTGKPVSTNVNSQVSRKRRKRGLGSLVPFEQLLMHASQGDQDPPTSNTFKFDDLPAPQCFSVADPATLAGYLCTSIRFHTVDQLLRIIEILKQQHLINDLLSSVLSSPQNCRTTAYTSSGEAKRRRTDLTPTLKSLFNPSLNAPTPIFLHLQSSPSLTLSFPAPQVSVSEVSPITLHITVDQSQPGGLKVVLEIGNHQDPMQECFEKRAANVLGFSRDLPLLMRWMWKELEKGKSKLGAVKMEING